MTDQPAPAGHRTLDSHLQQYEPPPQGTAARAAWDELYAIGCPLLAPGLEWGGVFAISGECNGDPTHAGDVWCDFYQEHYQERVADDGSVEWAFGINPKIHSVLSKHGFWTEWVNPGVVSVYARED